ncbi:MAG: hypothetical protein ABS79_01230 [Planctomycetes bacterium SCN 63-9]|nr:MAG: hypothetical protein ABS79_01230 [Planctomycetes bacterium SCN 63-9]
MVIDSQELGWRASILAGSDPEVELVLDRCSHAAQGCLSNAARYETNRGLRMLWPADAHIRALDHFGPRRRGIARPGQAAVFDDLCLARDAGMLE